jgi:hypothetical protein
MPLLFVLDPRAKMKGLHNILCLLSNHTDADYSRFPTEVRGKLTMVSERYEAKFVDARLHRPQQSASVSSGKKKIAWNKNFAADVGSSSSCGPSPLGRRTGTSFPSPTAPSELSSYLDNDCIVQYDEEFKLLNWWHEHERSYPVLSLLAGDVLTILASTISSESTFCLACRVIDERRP